MKLFKGVTPAFYLAVMISSLLITPQGSLNAQNGPDSLRFRLTAAGGVKVKLVEYFGHDRIVVDSVFLDDQGRGVFLMDDSHQPGMYRLEVNRNAGLDVIYNKRDLDITIRGYFRLDSVEVAGSEENRVFFDYINKKNSYENRLSLLEPVVMYYPPGTEFYPVAEREYLKLEEEYNTYIDSVTSLDHLSIAPTVIRWDQLPDLEVGEMNPQLREFYRKHYFESVSSDDTVMIRTPVLPVRIIDYLSLYVMPGISRESQEQEFISGVDALMDWSEPNPSMQEVVINYLIDGFQMYGFEKVMTHLVENYVLDNTCVSDQEQDKLRTRIEGFRKMAVGNTVPDFGLTGSEGEAVRLSETGKGHTLLVFWASWCPHCKQMLPGLNSLYDEFGGSVEFLGVSVDSDRGEWIAALEESAVDWPNAAELKGWEGQVVAEYYIYATPTLLLLDSDRKIVAKPGDLNELRAELKKL